MVRPVVPRVRSRRSTGVPSPARRVVLGALQAGLSGCFGTAKRLKERSKDGAEEAVRPFFGVIPGRPLDDGEERRTRGGVLVIVTKGNAGHYTL